MNERQVAFITGASRGIGTASALTLARCSYDIAMLADSGDELDQAAIGVREAGAATLVQHGTLLDLDFAKSAIDATVKRFGRIDVLVNNAAWGETVTMRRISVESWEKTLRICLTAPAFLARWAAEVMGTRRSGVIVNVSSIMSNRADGMSPAYTACKGALDSLTYELASLYRPLGIRVVAINPGATDTQLSHSLGDVCGDDVISRVRVFSEDMIMLRRWGKADEIAKLIAFIASKDASYLTGVAIDADGGWTRQHFPLSLNPT
jgi:3-oxoacyl-[acyl-carrier protein] reductase